MVEADKGICGTSLDKDVKPDAQEHTLSFAATNCSCCRVRTQKKHFDGSFNIAPI